jgi:hypothetical protein
MNTVDRTISNLPYVKSLFGDNDIQKINDKYNIFNGPGVTKDKQVQRLSITNQFDNQMEYTTNGGRVPNLFYHQLMSGISSENKKRRIIDFRSMSQYPKVENAVREICNEMFERDDKGEIFKCRLRGDYNDEVRSLIEKEFQKFLNVYKFEEKGWQYARDWITEGELFFENIVSSKQTDLGIIGTTRIAAERIDPLYYDLDNELIDCFIMRTKEHDDYPYQWGKFTAQSSVSSGRQHQPMFLNDKQITYICNDQWETTGKKFRIPILAHAQGPYRQLSLIEDATVIYMLVRAPERLVFNIDTGNLPAAQAEKYMKRMMASFWSKKTVGQDGRIENVYDPQGMLENYWFPKGKDGSGSTVESVGGGKQSADNLDTLNYFVQCLYTALHVPLGRLNSETAFSDGENITREELRFAEFIITVQKLWASAIKKSFIVHLKLRGKRLLDQAKKYKVNDIKVPNKNDPNAKENLKVSSVFKDNFNSKCWDYYDILSEAVSEKMQSMRESLVEEREKIYERSILINEELFGLDTQLITEADEFLVNKIQDSKKRLLTETTTAAKTLEFIDGKIKEIDDEGVSWWEQYDIQEEDIDVKMNEPTQFFQIREQQIFQQKLDNYTNIASQDFISATFAQKMWFGMSDEEILANRALMQKDAALRWELAQIEANGPDFREKALQEMEDTLAGGDDAGLGGLGGGGGGGGGLPTGGGGGDTSLPDFGAPPEGDAAATGGEGGSPASAGAPKAEGGGEKTAAPPPPPPPK